MQEVRKLNRNAQAIKKRVPFYREIWHKKFLYMSAYMPYINYDVTTSDDYIDYVTYKSDNYVVSPVAGFIFDPSDVLMEQTNLQTEIIASIYPIKFGIVPYEENIDAAISRLKAAGLDRYLEEYRSQFNAYLAEHPEVMEIAKGNQQ